MTKQAIRKMLEDCWDQGAHEYDISIFVEDYEETKEQYITAQLSSMPDEDYGEYQLCPKCNGQGIVCKPPWIPGDINEWAASEPNFECNVCNGSKIIPRPINEVKSILEKQ